MKKIIPILTNKYLIASIFFIIWMLFFDQRDYFQMKEQQKELKKLVAKKQFYTEEINKTKEALFNLEKNPAAIEQYAREHYLMKKDGEDLYLIEDSLNTPN